MSNLADPNSTVSFTYESLSGHARVKIRARFLSERDQIKLDELWTTARALKTNDPAWFAIRDEMLAIGIVQPSIDELKSTLSRSDLESLAILYPAQVNDIEAELGKSRSRPQFTREPSAADVVAASAIIPPADSVTLPTNTAPSN